MVTLNKPAAGDTDWTTEINDNWTTIENSLNAAVGAFQGRLQRDSTTQISIQRYQGDIVEVNGTSVSLGASGIALQTTDNLITSTGADSGGAMAASTLYYVYVSNSSVGPFASDLRASTTAPSLFNGIKYLGTSGNAANWRFVGWVRTNSSTQFVDSETQRFVINYYNRRSLRLYTSPGYNDNNLSTTWTTSSTTWTGANAGTGNRVEFIGNGEDPADYWGGGTSHMDVTFQEVFLGVAENASTAIRVASFASAGASDRRHIGVKGTFAAQEGYAYLDLMVAVASNTATFYADFTRLGASSDPAVTYLEARVMG